MFRKRYAIEDEVSQAGNERLSMLLRQWSGIEARPDFASSVWRRIRTSAGQESPGFELGAMLQALFAPPYAWVNALLVAGAILVGVWAGTSGSDVRQPSLSLLHSQTVAGSYLAMATGESR